MGAGRRLGFRLRPQHPCAIDWRRSATFGERYGVLIDPHTADGIKVGRELRATGEPLVCLETALPAKFAATIREALGLEPERPAAYADLEARPKRYTALPADAARVKSFIAEHAGAPVST